MKRLGINRNELESRLGKVEDLKRREEAQLNRIKFKAIERVEKNHQQVLAKVREKYETDKEVIEKEIAREGAVFILSSVTKSYQELQNRDSLSELDVAQVEQAGKLYSLVERAETEEEKNRIKQVIEISGISEGVKKALEMIEGGLNKTQEINSFISYGKNNGKNTIYLLIPVDGNENKKLATGLQDKIMEIISHNRIITNSKSTLTQRGEVADFRMETIKFKAEDCAYPNNFLMFTIIPENVPDEDISKLTSSLAAKIEELSNKELEKLKLIHEVIEADFPSMTYFATHNPEEIHAQYDKFKDIRGKEYVPDEEAARVLGFTKRGVAVIKGKGHLKGERGKVSVQSLIDYLERNKARENLQETSRLDEITSTDSSNLTLFREQKMKKAYIRLEEIQGDNLTISEVAYVFGFKNETTAYSVIHRKMTPKKEGKKVYVTKEDVRGCLIDYRFRKKRH